MHFFALTNYFWPLCYMNIINLIIVTQLHVSFMS